MSGQLEITRDFTTARARLFRAFTDPDELAAWFGPQGFHVPKDTITIEPRVGGAWKFVMTGEQDASVQSPVDATITEYAEGELLAGEETVAGFPGLEDGATVTLRLQFADTEAGSRLTVQQGPYPEDMIAPATDGWNSSLDKLAALVSPAS